MASSFLEFVATSLRLTLLPSWALLFFYLFIVLRTASNASPTPPARIWIVALWNMGIVGSILTWNGYVASKQPSVKAFVLGAPFGVVRIFLVPFCVSSYSGVASWAGESFWYIFPRDASIFCTALAVSCVPVGLGLAIHWVRRRRAAAPERGAGGPCGSECSSAADVECGAFCGAGADGPGAGPPDPDPKLKAVVIDVPATESQPGLGLPLGPFVVLRA